MEWSDESQYFTAGVSNPLDNGRSEAQFKTLTYNTNLPIADLNTSAAPSDNFDLLNWKLSVPIDTDNSSTADEIKEDALSNGYEGGDFVQATFYYLENQHTGYNNN